METFEEEAIQSSDKKPKCWFRYVDDTFVIWPHGKTALGEFLNHLNNQHDRIKFTMEIEENGKLPFLDVLVKRGDGNKLAHTVYRKKTHTDRYLHAKSHHHPQQKRSLIKTLMHRANKIPDEISKPEERKHVELALMKNGYTRKEIRNACHTKPKEEKEQQQIVTYARLPFIAGVTDRLKKTLAKKNIGVRYNTIKKIQQVLPPNKDSLPKLSTKGVYQLECLCGKAYIGQTGRSIKCRIKEHQRDARLRDIERSAIAEHLHQDGQHRINFEEVKILSRTENYYPRVIRESLEIMKNDNNFNREDGYRLSNTWKLTLHERKTIHNERRNIPNAQDLQHQRSITNPQNQPRVTDPLDQPNVTVQQHQPSVTEPRYITRSRRQQHQSLE